MKPVAYFVVLLLAVACVVLSIALVMVAQKNQSLIVRLQAQQQNLNQGILGPQAQQISSGVIQDLVRAGGNNREIRRMLEKHGFTVPVTPPAESAPTPPEKKGTETESIKPEATNP